MSGILNKSYLVTGLRDRAATITILSTEGKTEAWFYLSGSPSGRSEGFELVMRRQGSVHRNRPDLGRRLQRQLPLLF